MTKDVFLALAAVGWADGNLDADEADAIVKAALEAGLDLKDIEPIEDATQSRVELSSIDTSNMNATDKRFVLAVACWIASLDGELARGEAETIAEIAKQLGIDAEERNDLEIMVRQVAYESGGDSPFQYDLGALHEKVAT